MPANKNALIRYKTIDNCLRNKYRRWTLNDLVEDGSCVFKIEIVINFEMYSVFMSYGPGVRILSPRQAVSYMRDKTKEMALLYEQDFSNHNETKK